MDKVLIEQKLKSLRRALTRVKAKCPEDEAIIDIREVWILM